MHQRHQGPRLPEHHLQLEHRRLRRQPRRHRPRRGAAADDRHRHVPRHRHRRDRPVGRLDDGGLRRGRDGVPQQRRRTRTRSAPRPPRIGLALALCAVLGAINGVLIAVVGLQPFITTLVMMLAGRGLAKVITGGQNTTAVNERYRWIANGYVLGLPVVFLIAVGDRRARGASSSGARRSGMMIESIGINAEASRLAGLNRRALLITVYIAERVPRRDRRHLLDRHGDDRRRVADRLPVRARRDPRRRDRRHLARRRQVLARRCGDRRGAHRHARQDGRVPRRPGVGDPGVQGGRDHRPVRRAVAPLPRRGSPSASATARAPRRRRWWRRERRPRRSSRPSRSSRPPTGRRADSPAAEPSADQALPGPPPRRHLDRGGAGDLHRDADLRAGHLRRASSSTARSRTC